MGRGTKKVIIIIVVTLLFIYLINIIADYIDSAEESKQNTEVTQQLKDECSKEPNENICD